MFVFFGLVAVCGTQLVVGGRIDSVGVGIAIAIGSFASAILVTNNPRDIDSDAAAGKLTAAVRPGDYSTRYLYAFLMTLPFFMTVVPRCTIRGRCPGSCWHRSPTRSGAAWCQGDRCGLVRARADGLDHARVVDHHPVGVRVGRRFGAPTHGL